MFYKVSTSMKKKLPRKRTNKPADVSVQPTGKWIERIRQSERALRTNGFTKRSYLYLYSHYMNSSYPAAAFTYRFTILDCRKRRN